MALLLSGFLYLALVGAMAFLPARDLLSNAPAARPARLAAGVAGGLASVAIMAMAMYFNPDMRVAAHPTATAVLTFLVGPLAGAVSGALTLAYQAVAGRVPLLDSVGVVGMALLVGMAWRTVRHREKVNAWIAIVGLAVTLPPALSPWLIDGWEGGLLEVLQRMPWRYTVGVLILGCGMELLVSRAASLQELRQREDELRMALEASGGGRWEWDVRTRRFSYQGSFYAAFGLPDGPVPDDAWERWHALRHPDDTARIAAHLQSAMEGREERYYAEFRMRDIHGQWRWLTSRGRVAERDSTGRARRVVGMDLDITAHHEAQQALRASEAKYTTIYQLLPDPAGISRVVDGRYIEVNAAFTEIFGIAREEAIGRTSLELGLWLSPQDRVRMIEMYRRNGQVDRLPMVAQRQGVRIPGLMSARTVDVDGEACLLFVFHDMSNEQRSNDELLAVNSLLQQAGRLARLGVWEDIPGDRAIYWSDVCYEIHGVQPGAPLPASYIDHFVAPAWRSPVRELVRRCLELHEEWSLELEIVRPDGSHAWVRTRGEAVVEPGQPVRMRGITQDIDDAKRSELRLRQSEDRFARIFQLLPYPMGLTRRSDGRYVDVNPAWEEAVGYTREEATSGSAISLGIYTPEVRGALVDATVRQGQLMSYEAELTTRTGEVRTVLQSMRAVDFDGQPCWLFALHDITERKRSEGIVREREALLSLTISAASLGLWDWDLQTGTVTGDTRWRGMQGTLPSGSAGHPVAWDEHILPGHVDPILAELERHAASPATPFDATWAVEDPHGGERWVRNLGKIVSSDADGRPLRMVGVGIDVTRQRQQEEQLQHMAHFDALTGLPNRVLLARKLQDAMGRAHANGRLLGVAYLDLDGFKPVNDRLGHGAGDRLLVIVAGRLTRALRATDCVARLGGDEFVILLPGLASREDGERLLQQLMLSVAAPYTLDTESVTVTASIGYTVYPDDDADADTLLRHADQAMYQAKQAGRNRYHAFDAAHERAVQAQRAQGVRVREALRLQQFTLYLQPKVDMRHGALVGAEALARWNHPEHGVQAPGAFLPLIEGTELEVEFGEWVVDTALAQIRALQDAGLDIPLSVNISALHLQREGFADWLGGRLAAHPDLPPRLLDLEITESAALYDIEHVAAQLQRLRDLGVSVSLDDFGTGYSSLTYLRRLPMDVLKLDQSFVHGMMDDAGDLAIVQGVIGLARSFGYRIVAEGVETVEQGQMLLQMGCTLAQGYCIARPMPLAEFPAWAARWQPPAGWLRGRPL